MRMLSRPQECINVGCIACCGMADYEFFKRIFLNEPQKCPNYKRGMLPMSVIEDIKAEIEQIDTYYDNDSYVISRCLEIIDKHISRGGNE